MAEIDLTPSEALPGDAENIRSTLRAESKKMGHDYRDEPAIDRAIDRLRERILTSPDRKSVVVLDKAGVPMRGLYPLRRLAEEMIAALEDETGPTDQEVLQSKLADYDRL